MITVKEFQKLSDHEQEIVIFNEAKLVRFIIEGKMIICFYNLDSFFVELKYEMITYSIISRRIITGEGDPAKFLHIKKLARNLHV